MKFEIGDTVILRLHGLNEMKYITKKLFISQYTDSIHPSVFTYSADINQPIDFPDFTKKIVAYHYEESYTPSRFLLTEKKGINIIKNFSTI